MNTTTSSVSATMAGMEDTETVQRPWRTLRLPPVVGIPGAAAILGVHATTIHLWLKPGSGSFPPDMTYMIPPARVGKTADEDEEPDGWPFWDRQDVVEFAQLLGRRRSPAGQAKPRQRAKGPEALREQIRRLQAQLAAVEAEAASSNGDAKDTAKR